MGLNYVHFDFDLTAEGWKGRELTSEEAFQRNPECLVTIRVTEVSGDNKPDIWYKAQIMDLCLRRKNKPEARRCFEKFGLPKMMEKYVWTRVEQFTNEIVNTLENDDDIDELGITAIGGVCIGVPNVTEKKDSEERSSEE